MRLRPAPDNHRVSRVIRLLDDLPRKICHHVGIEALLFAQGQHPPPWLPRASPAGSVGRASSQRARQTGSPRPNPPLRHRQSRRSTRCPAVSIPDVFAIDCAILAAAAPEFSRNRQHSVIHRTPPRSAEHHNLLPAFTPGSDTTHCQPAILQRMKRSICLKNRTIANRKCSLVAQRHQRDLPESPFSPEQKLHQRNQQKQSGNAAVGNSIKRPNSVKHFPAGDRNRRSPASRP